MTIYRGYEITQRDNKLFFWADDKGKDHGGYATEEAALDAIDAHKREQRSGKYPFG